MLETTLPITKKEKKTFYGVSTDLYDFGKTIKIISTGASRSCPFLSEDEARADFNRCLILANAKFDAIKTAIATLETSLDFFISSFCFGDTHGIYDDGLYLDIKIENYNFCLKYNSDE